MRFGDNVGKFMYLVPDLEALHVSQTRPNKRNKQDAIEQSNRATTRLGNRWKGTYSIGAESDAQALSMTGLYLRQYLIIECNE